VAKRRGNHEGCIYQRKDKNDKPIPEAWVGQVSIGFDPATGNPKRQTFYGKSRREVAAKVTKVLHEQNIGAFIDPNKITLGEWLTRWLRDYKKLHVEDTTFDRYEAVARLYLVPPLGKRGLRQLQAAEIQAVFTSMLQKGLGRRTVQLARTVLKMALKQALEEGLIARNPADATKLPPLERKKDEPYFTREEALHLLDVANKDRLYAVYYTAIMTGLRCGELLGLKWEDIDLKAKTLTVRRCLVEVKDPETGKLKLNFHPPKTEKSSATVPLEDDLVKALEDHMEKQDKERFFFDEAYQEKNLVFCTEEGKLIWPRNFRHSYKRLLKRAELQYRRPHSMRHTFCTLLLEAGEDLKNVQELARHSSIQMTADIYSHVLDSTKRKAVDKLGQILKPAPTE
jgi:integrase